jgi:WD40 repeat protein
MGVSVAALLSANLPVRASTPWAIPPLPREIKTADGPVLGLVFSSDGKRLAARGTSVSVWDTATGKQLMQWPGRCPWSRALCFSPEGNLLAAGGPEEGSFQVFDTTTGKTLLTRGGSLHPVVEVAFLDGGKKLVTANGLRPWLALTPELVCLWDVATGKQLRQFKVSPGNLGPVAFGHNGKLLASADWEMGLGVWDVARGKQLFVVPDSRSACFSPDGRSLAVCDQQGKLTLWEILTGKQRVCLVQGLDSGGGLAFNGNGKYLAWVGNHAVEKANGAVTVQGVVKVWNAWNGREVFHYQHSGSLHGLAFSPSSPMLAVGGDGMVLLWTNHWLP